MGTEMGTHSLKDALQEHDMAREMARLSDRRIRTAKPKGKTTRGEEQGRAREALMLCDGGGLYCQITVGAEKNVRRSWIFRYQRKGERVRDMGLGSLNDVGLAEAREIARRYRNLVKEGKDPIWERDAEIARNLAASAVVMSFDKAAETYIAQHRSGWKNPTHAAQWPSSLKKYASPFIGKMSVADIDTPHVLKVLNPIWHAKPDTAKRVRGRIESILGWAKVQGYRTGDNPARWNDHLENALPAPSAVRKVKHQAALAYIEMPTFLSELRERKGISALALEFSILTAVRSSDVLNAKRDHVDRLTRIWVIPEFSKTGQEHRVPLSDAALAVIHKVEKTVRDIGGEVGKSEFLFPNDVTGAALSSNAMLALLDRMGRKGAMTTHGCRATFRTWAQEKTNFPWELCELSLGHKVGTEVERAYARGDALKKRFAIMQQWANFCARPSKSGKVVKFERASA
jgi:integrase